MEETHQLTLRQVRPFLTPGSSPTDFFVSPGLFSLVLVLVQSVCQQFSMHSLLVLIKIASRGIQYLSWFEVWIYFRTPGASFF